MSKPDRVYPVPHAAVRGSSSSRVKRMVDGHLDYSMKVETVLPQVQLEIAPGVYQHISPDGGSLVAPGEPKRLAEKTAMRIVSSGQERDEAEGNVRGGDTPEHREKLRAHEALSKSRDQRSAGAMRVGVVAGPAVDPRNFSAAGGGGKGREWFDPMTRSRVREVPTPPGLIPTPPPTEPGSGQEQG